MISHGNTPQNFAAVEGLITGPPTGDFLKVMQPFDRLVGSWNLDITDIGSDGATRTHAGTWRFAWGLGGRAILDVWTVPGREQGLTVRFFDPKLGAWRSTWLAPGGGVVMPFIGRYIDGEIVLIHVGKDGVMDRWSFYAIEEHSFKWRGESSTDNGHSWRLEQTMDAVRTHGQP